MLFVKLSHSPCLLCLEHSLVILPLFGYIFHSRHIDDTLSLLPQPYIQTWYWIDLNYGNLSKIAYLVQLALCQAVCGHSWLLVSA